MQQLLQEKQVLLKFGGIDTFATVTLNRQKVMEANNFHRHWTVAVKDLLVPGTNQLGIAIRPAMQESLQLKEQYPYTVPALHQMGSIGAYNFIRKPVTDGGWDWGPAYMASGIHGSVELVGFSNAVLEDAWVQQNKVGDQYDVVVTSDLLVPPGGDSGELTVAIPELGLQATQQVQMRNTSSSSSNSTTAVDRASFFTRLSVNSSEVELWWPVGYGSPHLYNVTVTYTPDRPVCTPAIAAAATAATGAKESNTWKAMQDSTPAAAGTAAVPVSTASLSAPLPGASAAEAAGVAAAGGVGRKPVHATKPAVVRTVGPKESSPGKDVQPVAAHSHSSSSSSIDGAVGSGSLLTPVTYSLSSANQPVAAATAAAAAGSNRINERPGHYAPNSIGFTADEVSDLMPPLLQEFPESHPGSKPSKAATTAAARDQQLSSCAAVSTRRYRIGFRTVELVRLPLPEAMKDLFPPGASGWDVNSTSGEVRCWHCTGEQDGSWALSALTGKWQWVPYPGNVSVEGESFYFKVNGVPIYMKGANLVPMNILPTNVTKDMIHDMLDYALESNMNMVRIWGGGMYPVPEVFDYADEKGLLMWMETMFACAPFPRDVAFLENVAAEVTQQVHRLSWHPSIAAWSGNNEVEGSLGWFSESRTNMNLFVGDYIALFIDTIRAIIKKDNPSMPFVDSSPSNGAIIDTPQQYVKRWGRDNKDPRYGDVHYYGYDADCEDFSTYPKAKFISEFGSMSYPTFQTYASVTTPEDWQVDNSMTGFRNRRFGNGLEVFESQFKRHFRLPANFE